MKDVHFAKDRFSKNLKTKFDIFIIFLNNYFFISLIICFLLLYNFSNPHLKYNKYENNIIYNISTSFSIR